MIGFTSAFALLIGIGVLGYQQNVVLVRDATAVSHTHQVIARLANLMGAEDVADSDVQLAALTHASDTITAARRCRPICDGVAARPRTMRAMIAPGMR